MNYLKFGTGDKLLVILPGLSIGNVTSSGKSIAEAYKIFWEEYTVYLFDRRKDLPEKYSINDMADDTVKAMDTLGIRKPDIFGVSQGGMIAQCIAIYHPDSVGKLVLGSTMSRINPTAENVMNKWLDAAQNGDKSKLADSFMKALYTDGFIEKFGTIVKFMLKSAKDRDVRRFIKLASCCRSFSVYDELRNIKCPVLVIGAECDEVATKEASEEIAEALKCELYIYPAPYAHAVYDEAQDYKTRILNFLDQK